MNLPLTPRFLSNLALVVGVFALGAVVAPVPAVAGTVDARISLDDQAPALPLSASFDKVTDPDTGPNVLHLKNDSANAIKASASIQVSVASHGSQKDRKISGHVIEPGDAWTITGLAAGDKITVTADGFAPLDLTVP